MTPAQARKWFDEHQTRYVLAQFVDIHGAAKAKAVPVEHYEMVIGDGAGFAGFAVWGLGMGPHGPDFMGVGDPDTVCDVPWMPGFARIACDGHVRGKPYAYCSRVTLKRALQRFAERGYTLYTGIEPEFMLLRRTEQGTLAPFDPTDGSDKPCYDYKGLARVSAVLDDLSRHLRAVGIDVYQIDHEDANGQFEINFTYADALKSADNMIFFKMAASEIAREHGAIATFMPKPFSNRTGTGSHFHLSIGTKEQKNAFYDKNDKRGMGLSQMGYWFLGGPARAFACADCDLRPHGELIQTTGGRPLAVRRHLGAGLHRLRRQQPHRLRARALRAHRVPPARWCGQPVSGHRGPGRRGPGRHRPQARSRRAAQHQSLRADTRRNPRARHRPAAAIAECGDRRARSRQSRAGWHRARTGR